MGCPCFTICPGYSGVMRSTAGKHEMAMLLGARSISPDMRKGGLPAFNHAMIYVSSLERSLEFYQTGIGFEMLERQGDEYARLKSPAAETTIALHRNNRLPATGQGGIRLYFEVEDVDAFCSTLETKGFKLEQRAMKMPWGWTHAYLRDPDGNEVSIYSAGEMRLRKSA